MNRNGHPVDAHHDARRNARGHTAPAAASSAPPVDGEERIPARGQYTEAARLERLDWVRARTDARLAAYEGTRLAPERLTGNVENMVGAVEVPVGLVGPLLFRGEHARGLLYAPFATTEGALVASACRGARALTRSGGVTTRVVMQRMMRVPLFAFRDLPSALRFADRVRARADELRERTGRVSRNARLVAVEPLVVGRLVHVHLGYETGDAAGQNMTTACAWDATRWLAAELETSQDSGLERYAVEANLSGDKKVSVQPFLRGRGTRVIAECVLKGSVVERVLNITPEALVRHHAAMAAASAHIGMVGHNINVANAIAALFTATGQDIACVHESSIAHLHLEQDAGDVYVSLTLPGLIVGTVGGGTHLPSQQAGLEMLGCVGAGKSPRLAEAIAGFTLGLELSTLAALATNEFASAHERLGRNRPVRWLTSADLTPAFFDRALREARGEDAPRVVAVEPVQCELGSSILTELTGRRSRGLVGFAPLRLRHPDGAPPTEVVAKVKPLDEEVLLALTSMASLCGPAVGRAFERFRDETDFVGCHVRELAMYGQRDPRLRRHMPAIHGIVRDDAREAYVLVLERLQGLRHMDSADDVSGWTGADVETVLRGAAEIHSVWLGREEELCGQPWLGPVPSAERMVALSELWEALAHHAASEFPDLVRGAELQEWLRLVRTVSDWWPALESMPRTLIHNDFNPRNLAIRPGLEPRVCVWDWELATLHVPQHDLAELLCFVLDEGADPAQVDGYVELHRAALESASGRPLEPRTWREGYGLALRDLAVNRFGLYLMAHTFRHYGFMERTVRTLRRLLAVEAEREAARVGA